MTTFIKIAWRNILRSKKRSLITISAVGFGLGALIFIWSFVEGSHKQMIENYTSYVTAQVQVQKKGYQATQKLENYLEHPQEIIRKVKTNPNVIAVSPRIRGEALMSSADSSVGVMVLGINPAAEKQVSVLHKRLKKGKYLSTDDTQIVLGAGLAKNLNVDLGDKVVLMGQALDGSIAGGAYHVAGLIETGAEEIDKGLVLITRKAAEDLFVMNGKVSQIAIKLNDVKNSDRTAAELTTLLHNPQLEILPWRKVSPILQQWLEYDATFVWIIVMIVMVVVAIGILNTVLMGVLERTREFGILQAIGTKGGQIILMVTWESIFLGSIGTVGGFLLGIGLTGFFGQKGIDLSLFTNALNAFYMESIIYPTINWQAVWISVGLVLVTSFVASFYPAWYASRLEPVEAIRSL